MNRLLLLYILLLFTVAAAQGQPTSVTGRVVDGADQAPLIGANIRLRGLGADSVKNGAAADAAGNFTITGLPAGRYELTVSFLGYQTLQRQLTVARQPLALGTGNLTYTKPVSPFSQVQAEYRVSYTPNDSDRKTYDFSPGEQAYSLLNDTLSSVFQSRYLTNVGELSYRYQHKDLQWMVGAAVQNARLRGDQEFPRPTVTERTFLDVLPNALVRYNFSRQQNLRLIYRAGTNPPSVSQL